MSRQINDSAYSTPVSRIQQPHVILLLKRDPGGAFKGSNSRQLLPVRRHFSIHQKKWLEDKKRVNLLPVTHSEYPFADPTCAIVNLDTLEPQQLAQVKKQLDEELEHLTTSFAQLHAAQNKFKDCLRCVKSRAAAPEGT